jgi:hypothetical protein
MLKGIEKASGSVSLVHVHGVCLAHLFVAEKEQGRVAPGEVHLQRARHPRRRDREVPGEKVPGVQREHELVRIVLRDGGPARVLACVFSH